ncbi:hypothetical protein F5Y15DRAFT_89891 [Xylariaceae sp. FL0016]|nr:hypothetical protein F5Y15DRAFT_89891 [Xylariaceae sp. FL0016]
MATANEKGTVPRRKVVTYGKGARPRQPKTAFNPALVSESMSEDDTITASASKTTDTRRKPSLLSSPRPDAPQGQSSSIDDPYEIPSSERKRKISQVSRSPGQLRRPKTGPMEETSPSAPSSRRPRTTAPTHAPPLKSRVSARARTPVRQSSADSMDLDASELKLSSPPLTPTPPTVVKKLGKTPLPAHQPINAITNKVKRTQKEIPLHIASKPAPKATQSRVPSTVRREKASPASSQRPSALGTSHRPRKRLIDTLAEQATDDTDEVYDEATDSQVHFSRPISSQTSDTSILDTSSMPSTPKPISKTATNTAARTYTRSSSALKFTYGQGIKVREEEGEETLLESFVIPGESSTPLKGRRLELAGPKPVQPNAYDDDDHALGGSPSSKLRDIHELRQAGAVSRVADSMQDLVDQMGIPGIKPSSSRRAALLQLAEKIQDKSFIRQCRDHGVETKILENIGDEGDVVAGFLIISILITILIRSPNPHTIRLLRLEKSGPLFARLLHVHDDIKKIARDRKTNLSKRSQNSMLSIQNSLCGLPWDEATPTQVSPRSLAIRCLEILIKQDPEVGRDAAVFTSDVTQQLFRVLSDGIQDSRYWDYPATEQSINLCGALSLLGSHAVSVTEHAGKEWITEYLPIVAEVFNTSLQDTTTSNKRIEDSVLKLTINITNNNLEAPDIFTSKGLLPALAGSISSGFTKVLTSISEDSWAGDMLDSLVLRLGILINFSEHSSLVRQVVYDSQYGGQRPADHMIRLFLENHRRTSEADSMEKSQLNVVFGYLSVLLGYLALHAPVRHKIKSSHSARSIGPLVDSIREFIAHHRKLEQAMEEHEEGSRSHGYTEGLQNLAQQLEDQAAFD